MSLSTQLLTNLFVVLTLLANAVALWVLVAGALWVARIRRPLLATAGALGPWARPLAVGVAATCTAGSLYYSEIVGFTPCQLCWYQRFAMYPLVAILALGFWPPARVATRIIGLVVAAVGAGIAFYHWLVERVPALAETSACSVTVPCSAPWFTRLGFVTIAWMALSGFLAIGALLACEAVAARTSGRKSAKLGVAVVDESEVSPA